MVCTACNRELRANAFQWRYRNKERHRRCKTCVNTRKRETYRGRPDLDKIYARKAAQVRKLRRIVRAHLKDNPCVDCGEQDVVVLQFDHVRGTKGRAVSEAV